MSHSSIERDERVKRCPERVFIELDDNGDYHTSPRGFHDAEYIRADHAATRMRDRCVAEVRRKADSYQKDSERPDFLPNYKKQMALAASTLREAATELQSLTLEGEQEK